MKKLLTILFVLLLNVGFAQHHMMHALASNTIKLATVELLTDTTDFAFQTDAGVNIIIVQDGITSRFAGNGATDVTITGVDDASEIDIFLDGKPTFFKFKSDDHLTINLKDVGSITTLANSFDGLASMTTFECDANFSNVEQIQATWKNCSGITSFPSINTSNIYNFSYTWQGCLSITSFPSIDVSSGLTFPQTWRNCTALICIGGTLDFTNLTNGILTFGGSTNSLVQPAATGTNVRSGDNALAGTWTNAGSCP